ncbi:MAG: 1-deoxy-D-xylulose-5-phosphate synthase [Clostridia bacterium]|nr:1-deoxy-D-xylulose-5-phosphate synthase [Clostridia bacterium]
MKLTDIHSPKQLKGCGEMELQALAQEMRQRIIDTVQQNGGHLASNLGVVELTIALHRVFDCPEDKLLFDVGHQCYAHKLLTGRQQAFSSLRQTDGLCGFPSRLESEYDPFADGHASTAISAAVGLCRARDMQGQTHRVVAVVGDGAMTGGMCYEALNDVGQRKTPLIIILNDNEMSIDKNVGALSQHLTHMRVSRGWLGTKRVISEGLVHIPVVGKGLYRLFRRVKNSVRNVFVRDRFFSSLGIRYFGPIDGHDIMEMERVFRQVQNMQEPVVVHVVTKKGKGNADAEQMPERYHGVTPSGKKAAASFGCAAGEYVTALAEKNEKICVVTAAMTDSTGFRPFRLKYPEQLYDVGIAEEHAVTLAAGLAAGGMRPVVAIYETFMQRGFDQMLMDVCLQKLPVLFLMDRAGLGADDGPTHHGVFALPMLQSMPGLKVWAPRCVQEMKDMLDAAFMEEGPVTILYPRSEGETETAYEGFVPGKWETVKEGADGAIITFSSMVQTAVEAAAIAQQEGLSLSVINASCISPLDEETLSRLSVRPLYTLEESQLIGGFGSRVAQLCTQRHWPQPRLQLGIPDEFIPFGDRTVLLERLGLDAGGVVRKIMEDQKN